MLIHGVGSDNNVVDIGFCGNVSESLVHAPLKVCWSITQSKWEAEIFTMGYESCLGNRLRC